MHLTTFPKTSFRCFGNHPQQDCRWGNQMFQGPVKTTHPVANKGKQDKIRVSLKARPNTGGASWAPRP